MNFKNKNMFYNVNQLCDKKMTCFIKFIEYISQKELRA